MHNIFKRVLVAKNYEK